MSSMSSFAFLILIVSPLFLSQPLLCVEALVDDDNGYDPHNVFTSNNNQQQNSLTDDDDVVICTDFNYTLQTDSQDFDILSGLEQLDQEGKSYLFNEIEKADVNVTVLNFTSTGTQTCTPPDNPPYNLCSHAECSVCVKAKATIEQNLVDRLSLTKVRKFLTELNLNYTNELNGLYEYPIPVKSNLVLQLNRVKNLMDDVQKQALCDDLLSNFATFLANNADHIAFELDSCKVVVQQLVITDDNDRRLQLTADGDGQERKLVVIEGNKVELLLTADCAGQTVCTPDAMAAAVEGDATAYAEQGSMLGNLQASGTAGDYFRLVSAIEVQDTGVLSLNITELLDDATGNIPPAPTSKQDVDEEDVPVWIFILVGVSVLVLAVGAVWTAHAVKHRNKEAELRKAYDDHNDFSTPEVKSRGIFVTDTATEELHDENVSHQQEPSSGAEELEEQQDNQEDDEEEDDDNVFLPPVTDVGSVYSTKSNTSRPSTPVRASTPVQRPTTPVSRASTPVQQAPGTPTTPTPRTPTTPLQAHSLTSALVLQASPH